MSAGGSYSQLVGSAILLDVEISNTPLGIMTATTSSSQPHTSGSLILDNVKLTNVPVAIQGANG
jgi:glucan 1,3-beta-glucosidase